MVLMSRLSLLFLFACAPKKPVVGAASPILVDLALVASPMAGEPVDAPVALAAGISALLTERNLLPTLVSASEWAAVFAGRRLPDQRAAWLAERPGHAPTVLLVALEPRYFGFVNGRYRWSVTVELVLRDLGRPDHTVTDRFEVPALLTWDHEREDAAIDAASVVIRERISNRVDDWLGG